MSERKRLLNDLRVIDLRAELEKRNLDKSGVRGVLIQRLSKYLEEEEGTDPATYRFDLSAEAKISPTKRGRRLDSTLEAEASDEAPAMEDMIVQDDAGEEDEAKDAETDPAEESASESRKRENTDDSETTQPKKPCLQEDHEQKHENNTDADDSINLDLGEDELLNEETDSTTKAKMDEAGNDEAAEEAANGDAPGDNEADAETADNADASAATSTEQEKSDKDKDEQSKEEDCDKKDKKDDGKEGGARNLWVSGLSGDTRAKDLKQLCSKHGKVIGAKVVTNARTPGSRCYGYVTMASAQDAENCIKNLHRTELHGRMISVEKAKSESESASRRHPSRSERRSSKDRRDDNKDKEENKEATEGDQVKKEGDGTESHTSASKPHEKPPRDDKDRAKRSTRSRERKRSPREVLSFSKIWKNRDAARARERSRAVREEERRRRAAEEALRERERRQRQEKHRLQLEREKLRAEREKIEREKNELLRLERERHRLEREKLELERLELKREQLRLEEERRKRQGYEYRKGAASPPEPYERHKRAPPPPLSSSRGQFEAPPPPRFETGSYDRGGDKRDRERDYKRDYPRHVSSANIKYPSNGSTNDDSRQPMPPGTRPKEPGRSYETRDTRPYRPSPPSKAEPRTWSASSRYPDSAPPKGTAAGPYSGGIKPEPRAWNASSRYPDSAPPKGGSGGEAWSSAGGGETRYGSGGGGAGYEARYQPAYQPPPPGAPATYSDRYAPTAREYRKY